MYFPESQFSNVTAAQTPFVTVHGRGSYKNVAYICPAWVSYYADPEKSDIRWLSNINRDGAWFDSVLHEVTIVWHNPIGRKARIQFGNAVNICGSQAHKGSARVKYEIFVLLLVLVLVCYI